MTEHVMCELELAARKSIDWVRESHSISDVRPEDHFALLVQIALAGFYYDQAVEDNDMLRITGDPCDLAEALQDDMNDAGEGLSTTGFLTFRKNYPNWQDKLREIIARLEELRSTA